MNELVTPSPDRALYLRTATTAIAARLVGQMLGELADPSTESPSLTDQLMLKVLRPWMPKLRDVLLSKLSELDPASLERTMGAIAWSIDSLLEQAPGAPLPRYRADWDEAGRLVLLPLEEPAA